MAQLGSILPARYFGLLEPSMVAPFVMVIASLATLNVTTWLWLRRELSHDRQRDDPAGV